MCCDDTASWCKCAILQFWWDMNKKLVISNNQKCSQVMEGAVDFVWHTKVHVPKDCWYYPSGGVSKWIR